MKRVCEYCDHVIDSDEDMFCRYCEEALLPAESYQWYFSWWFFVPVFLFFGPLAVPLLLYNPQIKPEFRMPVVCVLTALWTVIFFALYVFIFNYLENASIMIN